jgi:hypothetical protein
MFHFLLARFGKSLRQAILLSELLVERFDNLLGVLEQLCLRPISGSFSFGASSSMRTVSMSAHTN